MKFLKRGFNLSRSSVSNIRSMLVQLYQDDQAIALLPHRSRQAFQAAILEQTDPEELLALSDA